MPDQDKGEWVIAQGTFQDMPIYLRIRANIPESFPKADYPQNLIVTWRYEPELEGLPSSEVLQSMELLEDLLMETLSTQHNQSHLLVVTTSNGMRQWLWKTTSAQAAVGLFGEALGGHPRFPIEINADNDPEWRIYANYLSQVGSS